MKQDRVAPQPFPHQHLSLCTCVCTCVHVWGACAFQERCVCVCVWRSETMRVSFFEVVGTLFLRQGFSLVWSLLSRRGLAGKPLRCLCFSGEGMTNSCWLYRKKKSSCSEGKYFTSRVIALAPLSPSIPPSLFLSPHPLKKNHLLCVCVPAHMHKHEPSQLSWRQPSMEPMR